MGQRPDAIDPVDPADEDRPAAVIVQTEETVLITPADASAVGDDVTPEDIERTRAEMSETIDAIKEKLSPQNLVEQAKESVREATIGKAEEVVGNAMDSARGAMESAREVVSDAVSEASDTAKGVGSVIVETIKENPVPAALIGIGIGWLYMNAQKQGAPRRYPGDYAYLPRYEEGSSVRETLGHAKDKVGDAAGQVQDKVGQVAGQVQDKAGQVAGQVQEKAGQTVSQVREKAGQLTDQAQERAQAAVGSLEQMVEENPLSVGAMALLLGAAVGLAVPETRKENQLMGEARERLVSQAGEKAQDVVDKAKSVAQEAVSAATDTAKQAARDQGLAPS